MEVRFGAHGIGLTGQWPQWLGIGSPPISGYAYLKCRADLAGREQGTAAAVETMASNERELLRLRDENNALKEALASLASSCMPDELREGKEGDIMFCTEGQVTRKRPKS